MAAWTITGYPHILEKIAEKQIDLSSDTITAHLSNTAPSTSHTSLSEAGEIATGGGYTQGTGLSVSVSSSTMNGTAYQLTLTGTIGFTASGTVATFRYVIFCFSGVSGDPTFVALDLGEENNLNVDDILVVDVNGTVIYQQAFS